MLRNGDLTQGGITSTLLRFTLPMMAGSLLQQCYNFVVLLFVFVLLFHPSVFRRLPAPLSGELDETSPERGGEPAKLVEGFFVKSFA